MRHHYIKGTYYSTGLSNGLVVSTANGDSLTIQINNGMFGVFEVFFLLMGVCRCISGKYKDRFIHTK